MLLQDSLGGDAKALMIANLAPSPAHAQETLSSLAFAAKARAPCSPLLIECTVLTRQTAGNYFVPQLLHGSMRGGNLGLHVNGSTGAVMKASRVNATPLCRVVHGVAVSSHQRHSVIA